MLQMSSYLYESWDNLREHLDQAFLRQTLNYFGEHLDGGQINGIVCRLNDGTQYFNALLWADGTCQHGRCFFCRPDHLHTCMAETHTNLQTIYLYI